MKQTITFCDFTDAFRDAGRADDFSYDALRVLFDYLEDFEDDTGEEYELDVVALCCDWTEYPDAVEAASELTDWEPDEDLDDEDNDEDALDYLRTQTTVIEFNGGLLVAAF